MKGGRPKRNPSSRIMPRTDDEVKETFLNLFPSLNSGYEYIIGAFPSLYRQTMDEIKSYLNETELSMFANFYNGETIVPELAGKTLLMRLEMASLKGLDVKVSEKISNLTIFQLTCLELWVRGQQLK